MHGGCRAPGLEQLLPLVAPFVARRPTRGSAASFLDSPALMNREKQRIVLPASGKNWSCNKVAHALAAIGCKCAQGIGFRWENTLSFVEDLVARSRVNGKLLSTKKKS